LGELPSLFGVFESLLRVLMASQVVFFSVMRRRCTMGVRSKFMELSRSLMRVVWHFVFLSLQYALIARFSCLDCGTCAAP
jgi:hypothetical protein